MIREWNSDDDIAEAAGENAVRFLRLLRDAGRRLNPEFRVMTRMESFYREHQTVWKGLGDGLDVESASLIARGWEMPYHHPKYADSNAVNMGTVYQNQFDEGESALAGELECKGARAHLYFAAGPQATTSSKTPRSMPAT